MAELLRENQLASRFRKLRSKSRSCIIAAPFWGENAIQDLALSAGPRTRVICNLASSACNPYEIGRLLELETVSVRTNSRLHAKVYAGPAFAIVGSSNPSSGGLFMPNRPRSTLIEQNVLLEDVATVRSVNDFLNDLWRTSRAITEAQLAQAKTDWDARPKGVAFASSISLLAACREQPKLFSSVFVAAYEEPLGEIAASKLKQVREESRASLGAEDFKRAWGYQFEQELPSGTWLIDLDCRNRPKVHGCSRTTGLRLSCGDEEHDLSISIRGVVEVDGRQFRLSAADKLDLETHAKKIFRNTKMSVMRLSEAIAHIDSRRR